jgi:Ca-activated chloride channel family protein
MIRVNRVHTFTDFFRILAMCLTVLSIAAIARAQSLDNAHIVPRTSVNVMASADIPDPELSLRPKPLQKDVDLVLVPVTVTDSMGRPVTDLSKQNFMLNEAGAPQQLRYFSREDGPISVALVLDYSASMENKIEYVRQAVDQFFQNANPDDDYFVILVSDRPILIANESQSISTIEERLASAKPKGKTPLFDAIYLGVQKMREARYRRRALLVVSDGGDNDSRYTRKEIKRVLEEADVLTYSIGIFDGVDLPIFKTFEERWGRRWLSEITDASGGRSIAADNRQQIPEIAANISRELRNQYVLGYRPSALRDGQWHKISVRVETPENTRLHVYSKEGYLAPGQ